MDTYAKRLSYAIKYRGRTQSEVAKAVGAKPQAIQHLCSNGDKSVLTVKIAEYLKISPFWLDLGKGEMELDKEFSQVNNNNEKILKSSQFRSIIKDSVTISKTEFKALSKFLSGSTTSQKDKDVIVLDCTDIEKEVSQDCFVVTIDDDRFKQSHFHPGDGIVIKPGTDPEENSVILIKFKPSNQYTFARYKKMGNKVFLTPLENDFKQAIDATDMSFDIIGVALAQSRKPKTL